MDQAFFTELLTRYQTKVYNLAYHITGNRQDAEDAVQETFLQVYRHLDDFRGDSSIYTWIYKIAKNICFKQKEQKTQAYVEDLEEKINYFWERIPQSQQDVRSDPENTVIINELTKVIRDECRKIVLQKLPEKQRLVFVMKVVLDLSYQEIAETLDIHENIIKARLHRARNSLLRHFQHRCKWYMHGEPSSCCREKVGYMLTKDSEALKRIYEGMKQFTPGKVEVDMSEKELQRLTQIYKQTTLPYSRAEQIKQYVMQAEAY